MNSPNHDGRLGGLDLIITNLEESGEVKISAMQQVLTSITIEDFYPVPEEIFRKDPEFPKEEAIIDRGRKLDYLTGASNSMYRINW